ncbi:MAG: SDR family oxidoreductase [Cypionkella sp.]
MKLLVLGATGGTGKAIVHAALTAGHEVTILVRNPEKAQDLNGARLIKGNALDPKAVAEALTGTDAVISALGTPVSPFKEVTLLSSATRILIDEMRRQGVSRLLAITGMGAGDSAGHGGFVFDRVFKPLMLRKVYQDKDRQEAIIRESGLDWTILRPSVLTDKPAKGQLRAMVDLTGFHGGNIARADVAKFILDELDARRWQNAAPLISW